MSEARSWLGVRLELARASNLPTVWTNVLVGAAVGVEVAGDGAGGAGAYPWVSAAWVGFAVSLMYVGGMVLNDVMDAGRDGVERPGRPIPSGRISRGEAGLLAWGLLVAGAVALVAGGGIRGHGGAAAVVGGTLVVAIAAYNVWHLASSMSVLLLGVCRGLAHMAPIVVIAGWDVPAWVCAPAVGAFAYTSMLSVVARGEMRKGASAAHQIAWAMPAAPLLIALAIRPSDWVAPAILAIVLTFWLARAASYLQPPKPRVKEAVLGMLAGFCVVDAWTLMLLDRPGAALAAGVCFVATVVGHRRIVGT